jgi:hypothetical protein
MMRTWHALGNGEIAKLENPIIEDKETRPARNNEGTLIGAMQKRPALSRRGAATG